MFVDVCGTFPVASCNFHQFWVSKPTLSNFSCLTQSQTTWNIIVSLNQRSAKPKQTSSTSSKTGFLNYINQLLYNNFWSLPSFASWFFLWFLKVTVKPSNPLFPPSPRAVPAPTRWSHRLWRSGRAAHGPGRREVSGQPLGRCLKEPKFWLGVLFLKMEKRFAIISFGFVSIFLGGT